MKPFTWTCVLFVFATASARAGLHYSGESFAELPSQWRGFLLDQRALRLVAVKPLPKQSPSTLRIEYEQARQHLEKTSRERSLAATEAADLGALHYRLGELDQSLAVLRSAQQRFPQDFKIVANLGTVWQAHGDLGHAAECLRQAVQLAPAKLRKYEEAHLKLVRLRQREARAGQELDDLFDIKFETRDSAYQPGSIPSREKKKLQGDMVAIVQQLALWLPSDGRLLWQLGEFANAFGDVRTAAAILDGCVTEFGMSTPELRRHRQATRALADEIAKNSPLGDAVKPKAGHDEHALTLRPLSRRPLLNRLDTGKLAPINVKGINSLPWMILGETTLDRNYRPTFPNYLKQLDGKRVALNGFMQPLQQELELSSFLLIEYPVGCWYCEMPDMTSIVFAELPTGKTTAHRRSLVKIVGTLRLNSTDPENFLFTIEDASVAEVD